MNKYSEFNINQIDELRTKIIKQIKDIVNCGHIISDWEINGDSKGDYIVMSMEGTSGKIYRVYADIKVIDEEN